MYAPRLEEHSLALLVVPQQRVFKGAPASVNLVIPLCIRLRATARQRDSGTDTARRAELAQRRGLSANELQPSDIVTSASLLGCPSAVSNERIPRAR
jgi:hypothetical protein